MSERGAATTRHKSGRDAPPRPGYPVNLGAGARPGPQIRTVRVSLIGGVPEPRSNAMCAVTRYLPLGDASRALGCSWRGWPPRHSGTWTRDWHHLDDHEGRVTVGYGPGPNPVFLPGRAFLTGPYKGAPFGLAIVVRAVAGPFDLGTVVVRQALHVDPTDAHVTVKSDPFPTILQGIPLRMRRVDVCGRQPMHGSLASSPRAGRMPVGWSKAKTPWSLRSLIELPPP